MKEKGPLYTKIVEAFEAGVIDRNELAKRFEISERTVRRYLDKWKRHVPVEEIRGPGQPRALAPRDRSALARLVSETPLASSKELASKIETKTGITVTPATIRNTLHSMGYKSSIPQSVPLMTDRTKERRVAWATENAARDWSRVIFSDETTIQLQANITRAWHRNESRPTCPRPKFRKKAMFWAAISRDFKTELHVVEGAVTARSYIELLREKFVPWLHRQRKGEYVFQQDNAPAHSAKLTAQFFRDENIEVLTWPANSPDLNPIENLWGVLKRNVDKQRPESLDDLILVAKREWKSIPLSTVRACIDSMHRRLAEVVERGGDKVDY